MVSGVVGSERRAANGENPSLRRLLDIMHSLNIGLRKVSALKERLMLTLSLSRARAIRSTPSLRLVLAIA